jgi:glycosyltransferase involved in cell wall biosynthesis
MTRIVLIIPTKNRRELLERAVKSILAQGGEWRAVIVNDGSTDDTNTYLDALGLDLRFSIIYNSKSMGVNVARNKALAILAPGEWGFFLDDDDTLLPGALTKMCTRISELPSHIEYCFFNSHIVTPRETFSGGYQFTGSEVIHDPSYLEVITKAKLRGDCKPAIAESLFAKGYRFAEDVNGFESEFNALVARDGVGIRFCREEITCIDQAHGMERLSDTAALRDPAAFVRVHRRMLRDHAALLDKHPGLLRTRALAGCKVALRARDPFALMFFLSAWARSML